MRRLLVIALVAALVVPAATAAPSRTPSITGKTLAGSTLKLSWYRGKWVLINVWASW